MKKLIIIFLVLSSFYAFADCKTTADKHIKMLADLIDRDNDTTSTYALIKERNNQYQYSLTVNTPEKDLVFYFMVDLNTGMLYSVSSDGELQPYINSLETCKKQIFLI